MVRCQGQSKTFAIKTRFAGRQRWITIGRFGSLWTVESARAEARSILVKISKGIDPSAIRSAEQKIPTVEKLIDRFLHEEVEPKRKPKTVIQYRDFLDRLVKPKIGKLRIDQVKLSDIATIHHDLRKTPYTANRTLATISVMFSWAELIGLREQKSNPAWGIGKYKEHKRERFLTMEELGKVDDVLRQGEADKTINIYGIAAIRLLIFTGARRDEILTLKWEYVDFDKAVLNLPDSKTGQKIVQLNAPALAVLAEIPKVAKNDFVIIGKKEGQHLVGVRKIWFKVCALAEIDDSVRVHDLRHSFGSVAMTGGSSLPMLGKLLGQTQMATVARYAHIAASPVRGINEKIGSTIDAAMSGKSAEIIPLKKKGQ